MYYTFHRTLCTAVAVLRVCSLLPMGYCPTVSSLKGTRTDKTWKEMKTKYYNVNICVDHLTLHHLIITLVQSLTFLLREQAIRMEVDDFPYPIVNKSDA